MNIAAKIFSVASIATLAICSASGAAPVRVSVPEFGAPGAERMYAAHAQRMLKAALAEEGRGTVEAARNGAKADCLVFVRLGLRLDRPGTRNAPPRYLQPYTIVLKDASGAETISVSGTADWTPGANSAAADPGMKICEQICNRVAEILLRVFKR